MFWPTTLGQLGGRWQESGGVLGLKYSFCRYYLEWCEQPEEIQQITKAKKKIKRYNGTEHGCGNIDPQTETITTSN